MAIYYKNGLSLFPKETVEEYLNAARICIETEKVQCTGSCYGMASIILIVCAIDAMGTFWDEDTGDFSPERVSVDLHDKTSKYFEAFFYNLLEKKSRLCKNEFTKHIYINIRNKAAHNGLLVDDYYLYPKENTSGVWFEKDSSKSNRYNIYLPTFLNVVEEAFDKFKRLYDEKNAPKEFVPSPNTALTSTVRERSL